MWLKDLWVHKIGQPNKEVASISCKLFTWAIFSFE